MWHIYTAEYYWAKKEIEKNAICSNTDGLRDCDTEWSESERERQLYHHSHAEAWKVVHRNLFTNRHRYTDLETWWNIFTAMIIIDLNFRGWLFLDTRVYHVVYRTVGRNASWTEAHASLRGHQSLFPTNFRSACINTACSQLWITEWILELSLVKFVHARLQREEFKPGNSTSDQHTQQILNLYCIWWHRNNHVEHSSNKPFSVSRSKLLVVCGPWHINRKENKDSPLRNGATTVHQPSCSTLTTAQVWLVLNVSERAEYRKAGLFYWIKKVNESWKFFFFNQEYCLSSFCGVRAFLRTAYNLNSESSGNDCSTNGN